MIKNTLDLQEIFLIFNERLEKNVSYCSIYDVIGNRKIFSTNEIEDIINKVKNNHNERSNISFNRKAS